jgi:hypothetical protein
MPRGARRFNSSPVPASVVLTNAPPVTDWERPSIEVIEYMCRALANGLNISQVYGLIGVPWQTFDAWINRGLKAIREGNYKVGDTLDGPKLFAWMVIELDRARALADSRLILSIRECALGGKGTRINRVVTRHQSEIVSEIEETTFAPPNWQAAAWLLEQADPPITSPREAESMPGHRSVPSFQVILSKAGSSAR